jgi:hypothetical protein
MAEEIEAETVHKASSYTLSGELVVGRPMYDAAGQFF